VELLIPVGSKNSSDASMVELEQTTEPFPAPDRSIAGVVCTGLGEQDDVALPLVRSFGMVVSGVLPACCLAPVTAPCARRSDKCRPRPQGGHDSQYRDGLSQFWDGVQPPMPSKACQPAVRNF